MNYKEHAKKLLKEWVLCSNAKPKNDVVDFQIEKDACSIWATQLTYMINWGSDVELAEACHQLEPRLKKLKEKIVIEVLLDAPVQQPTRKS